MKRPVIIYGAGVRLAGAADLAVPFAERLGMPVSPTWGGLDLIPSDHPLCIGAHGTHGTRAGNFALQNADYILAIGTRLDTKTTGSPGSTFAPGADILNIDIDLAESNKFVHLGMNVHPLTGDALEYMQMVLSHEQQTTVDYSPWLSRIKSWKARYPIETPYWLYTDLVRKQYINPYALVGHLSEYLQEDGILVSDTGCGVAWLAQAFRFKRGQRFLHDWNQTAMGWAIPAAIGVHYATGKEIVCVVGDGAFMMQNELATIGGRRLPIKIILLNNQGHAMCRQTQREWFKSEYESTSTDGGLCFPDFRKFAEACHVKVVDHYAQWMTERGPVLFVANIDPAADVVPKLHASKPLHDMQPYLTPEQLAEEMRNE